MILAKPGRRTWIASGAKHEAASVKPDLQAAGVRVLSGGVQILRFRQSSEKDRVGTDRVAAHVCARASISIHSRA